MPHDIPPGHLTRWNCVSITSFLSRHGFDVQRCRRGSITLERLLMKVKFKAGRFGSLGLVGKLQRAEVAKAPSQRSKPSWKVRALRRAARAKDTVLFGLPALALWLWLRGTRQHRIAMYVLARIRE
jgi:hypothetical protein